MISGSLYLVDKPQTPQQKSHELKGTLQVTIKDKGIKSPSQRIKEALLSDKNCIT